MDFKNLIDDELYSSLRNTFLAAGRGRRPDLPKDVIVNKKLLVQLYFLKEESSKSWKEINECLIKIAPEVGQHEARFRNAIENAFREFSSRPEDTAQLCQAVDFNFISPVLSHYGITRASLPYPPSTPLNFSITNEVVVEIELARRDIGLPSHFTTDWVSRLCGFPSSTKLDHLLRKSFKLYEQLRSKKGKYPEQLCAFMKAPFTLPTDLPVLSDKSPQNFNSKNCQSAKPPKAQDNLLKEKAEKIKTLEIALAEVTKEKFKFEQELIVLKEKVAELEIVEKHKVEEFDLRIEKEQEKRKADIKEFQKTIKQLKSSHDKVCKEYEDQISTLQSKLKRQISKMYENKVRSKYLSSELSNYIIKVEDLSKDPLVDIKLKNDKNNEYSDDVRRTVISLICEAGVSAKNVKNVIDIVSKNIFHHVFSQNLPCAQTALNMCDEGFVINNIQIAENILSCENVTLHSDGTSRDQKKIVGHQFTLDNGETFYLGFLPVATEDAQTLLDITMIVIEKINECYSDLSPHSSEHTLKEIFSKISSVMSDRAACMKLFGKKFESKLQSEIGETFQMNFLHCNAHFLLGISSCFEKTFCSFEHEFVRNRGEYLGRDKSDMFATFSKDSEAATNRIIRTVCNLLGPRGDQKNGCRPEWITFCSDSQIPSFKSNRFNCFFQAAAAILHHHSKLLTFFTSGILHDNPNLLIKSVTLDIQDLVLLSFVCSVALFYLKVTLPYWTLVKSDVKYTDFYLYVERMFGYFEKWSENPTELLDSSFKSIFEDFSKCHNSTIFDSVHKYIEKLDEVNVDLIKNVCKSLSKEVSCVTKRQLGDFLTDGSFSCSDEEVKAKLNHCPLTNLVGESAFGDFDYDVGKRRNVTLHNRSAVHSIKRNKTMTYLSKKSSQEQTRIFKIARRHGSKMRKDSTLLEERVKNDIRTKFVNNQQKKIDQQLRGMQQRTKIETDVAKHGGPCQNADDIDNLFERLTEEGCSQRKIVEIFKSEIRFHKLISKSKLLKFGEISFMINQLKQYLDCTLDDENPNRKMRKT